MKVQNIADRCEKVKGMEDPEEQLIAVGELMEDVLRAIAERDYDPKKTSAGLLADMCLRETKALL